jgi:hypothetical protein
VGCAELGTDLIRLGTFNSALPPGGCEVGEKEKEEEEAVSSEPSPLTDGTIML